MSKAQKKRIEELEKTVESMSESICFLLKTGMKLAKTQQNQVEMILKIIERIEQISTQTEADNDETIKALIETRDAVSKALGEVETEIKKSKKSDMVYIN